MSENKILGSESPVHGFPFIRTIKPRNIIDWLKHGLADLCQAKFASHILWVGFWLCWHHDEYGPI